METTGNAPWLEYAASRIARTARSIPRWPEETALACSIVYLPVRLKYRTDSVSAASTMTTTEVQTTTSILLVPREFRIIRRALLCAIRTVQYLPPRHKAAKRA